MFYLNKHIKDQEIWNGFKEIILYHDAIKRETNLLTIVWMGSSLMIVVSGMGAIYRVLITNKQSCRYYYAYKPGTSNTKWRNGSGGGNNAAPPPVAKITSIQQ
jgi:hypothetical protein